jgi:hypothetical protein
MVGQIIEGTSWRVFEILSHTEQELCLRVERVKPGQKRAQ